MFDYGITKISFYNSRIDSICCGNHDPLCGEFRNFETQDRSWLLKKIRNGKTFCKLNRDKNGSYIIVDSFVLNQVEQDINNGNQLPENKPRHKIFLSYYNKDELYRQYFVNLFGDLVINKSVHDGDISAKNSAGYIKRLIQEEYLYDVTMLVVLIGEKTKKRKYVDWEISGALNYKVGDHYAGLLGIVLPTHPDYGKPVCQINKSNFPKRFWANYKSGYAVLIDWAEDRYFLQNAIEVAFKRREKIEKITNSIPQMQKNTGK